MAVATIMALGGGGVIWSKYCGFSHSPRKASTRILLLRWRFRCSPSAFRAMTCAKSCLGSDMGVRLGDVAPRLSIALNRGEAECMLLGVLLLVPIPAPFMPGVYCAMPAEMATLVCRQRRKGDECTTTLCFLFLFLFLLPSS